MAHAGKLVIKQGVLAQAADAHSHAVLGVAVQLGLRTVRFLKVVQELLGSAGQVQFLCRAAEVRPSFQHLLLGGLFVKAYEHGCGVAVRNRHTEALCSDDRLLGIDDLVALNVAPQLQRLALTLLFLTTDIGDDIVDDLGHPVKGLACAGNGLIGADQRLVDAKVFHQGMQGRYIALQAAVGLDRDKTALGTQTFALCRDDLNMVSVDLRHDHRNIRGKAVCTVVGNHRALCLGIGLFQRLDLGFGHVHGAEDKIDLRGDFFHVGSIQHHHLLDALRHRGGHGPARTDSLLIGLARAPAGSGQSRQLEPGMILQQSHKTLTHHASCAYDTHFILFFHFQHLSFQKTKQQILSLCTTRLANRTAMQYNRYCLYRFYDNIDTAFVSIIGKANAQYVKKRFLV